jgi:hypothetical protein
VVAEIAAGKLEAMAPLEVRRLHDLAMQTLQQ